MAVAEKVGFDRRGAPVHKRRPDGEVIVERSPERERVRRNGHEEIRTIWRTKKVVDNDLPDIAEGYQRFRAAHSEPGVQR